MSKQHLLCKKKQRSCTSAKIAHTLLQHMDTSAKNLGSGRSRKFKKYVSYCKQMNSLELLHQCRFRLVIKLLNLFNLCSQQIMLFLFTTVPMSLILLFYSEDTSQSCKLIKVLLRFSLRSGTIVFIQNVSKSKCKFVHFIQQVLCISVCWLNV